MGLTTQPGLFGRPVATQIQDPPRVDKQPKPKRSNPRDEAERWIHENPKGWAAFEHFALQALNSGRPCGINLLRERVRWEVVFIGGDRFKFDNRLSPYVARALIEKHPALASVLACRKTHW